MMSERPGGAMRCRRAGGTACGWRSESRMVCSVKSPPVAGGRGGGAVGCGTVVPALVGGGATGVGVGAPRGAFGMAGGAAPRRVDSSSGGGAGGAAAGGRGAIGGGAPWTRVCSSSAGGGEGAAGGAGAAPGSFGGATPIRVCSSSPLSSPSFTIELVPTTCIYARQREALLIRLPVELEVRQPHAAHEYL